MNYEETYRRSIDEPEAFWGEEAKRIHWHKPPQQVLDYSNPPFRRWFVGGETNLCYNAVDRHLATRADQLALVAISTETNSTREITYRQLYREVNDFAAVLKHLGVGHGDRVVIYMPNMAEAVFAMLACARIGAVHSVVFGGFAAHNLALRIDDAKPKLLIAADAGMRGGKLIPYKPMVDAACAEAASPPPRADRLAWAGCRRTRVSGRDVDYAALRAGLVKSMCRCSGLKRASRATCCTPPAPPASRRACSAMSVVTRWRWRSRWRPCSTASRAR